MSLNRHLTAKPLKDYDPMKTRDELKAAFGVYYLEMDKCEAAGAYWALLHLAVVLPDICAALESDPSVKIGARYIDWCAAHFPSNPRLTDRGRYPDKRNAVLHEGRTLPINRAADKRQQTQFASFSFVEPGAVDVEVHPEHQPGRYECDTQRRRGALADETRKALEHWFDAL